MKKSLLPLYALCGVFFQSSANAADVYQITPSQLTATTENFTSANLAALKTTYASLLSDMKAAAKNGTVFIITSNQSKEYAPAEAGMPILDSTLIPNVINTVGYSAASIYTVGENTYKLLNIGLSNMMTGGQESTWSLGVIGSGTTVQSAAQAVQTLFPYMDSRKVAGVLLSTAMTQEAAQKAKYLNSEAPFIYRLSGGTNIFTFLGGDETQQNTMVAAVLGAGNDCTTAGVLCRSKYGEGDAAQNYTFEMLFGSGILNQTAALKGPAAFEAARLTAQEYDDTLNAYFYTVNMGTTNSTWSNDIVQIGTTPVGLKKSGTGTLTMTGANTYTGDTLIQGGKLFLNGGGSEDSKASLSSNVTVFAGTSLQTTGYTSLSNITNAGTVALGGTSSFSTLTNNSAMNNTLSGTLTGTIVNAGKLSSVGATLDGAVTNNASANFSTTASTTFKGALTNYGTFTVGGVTTLYGETANYGTFTVGGVTTLYGKTANNGMMNVAQAVKVRNTFINSGTIAMNANTMNLAVSTDPNPAGIGVLGNLGTIILQSGSTISLTHNALSEDDQPYFYNSGVLNIAAGGTVSLSTVGMDNGGYIYGNSNATSRITGTAPLKNTGTINSNLYVQTLTNNGGSIVIVPVVNDAPIPLMGQTFDLKSGLLTFDISQILPFNEPTGGTYTLIQTTNSLTIGSNFNIETLNSPYLNLTPTKTATTYSVVVAFNTVASKSPTFDAEEMKVGRVIDRYFFTDVENTIAGFYYLSEADLRKKINEMRENVQPLSAEQLPLTHTIADNVYTRLFSLRNENYISPNLGTGRAGGESALSTRNKVWGQFIAGFSRRKADKETSSKKTDSQILGVMFGYDFSVTDNFLLGITGGYAETQIDQGQNKTDVTDWRAGVYFDANAGNFSFEGLALAGKQDFSADKRITIPGLTAQTKADFSGTSYEGGLNIGYRLFDKRAEGLSRQYYGKYGRKTVGESYFTMRPYVSGYVSKVKQDAYKETGHPLFIMSVDEASDTSVSVQPGVAMRFSTLFSDIHVDIGWQRLLSGGTPETTAYFIGDSLQTPFKTLPAQDDKDFLTLGLGFSTQLLNNVSANVWTNAKASKETLSTVISASVIYSW